MTVGTERVQGWYRDIRATLPCSTSRGDNSYLAERVPTHHGGATDVGRAPDRGSGGAVERRTPSLLPFLLVVVCASGQLSAQAGGSNNVRALRLTADQAETVRADGRITEPFREQ